MDDAAELPVFPETADWDEVQAALTALELGDGLPLVPPTERRLEAMLAGIDAPERSLGPVPPLFGELTAAAVAYNGLLAGCRPAELPIVLTAARACLAPDFNLLGLLTTTGTPAVAVIVHGPVARRLGLNAGTNCLGPGHRANACVGRAVSLVLRNIGGAREGIGDMATMGQPGKYTFCFAENDDAILPPLHVRRGFAIDSDAVTVLGVSGTAEILPNRPGDRPETVLDPLATAMAAANAVSGAMAKPAQNEQIFLLPPELARLIIHHDWDLPRLQNYLADNVGAAPADIQPIVTGGAGIKMTYLPLWAGGSRSQTVGLPE